MTYSALRCQFFVRFCVKDGFCPFKRTIKQTVCKAQTARVQKTENLKELLNALVKSRGGVYNKEKLRQHSERGGNRNE